VVAAGWGRAQRQVHPRQRGRRTTRIPLDTISDRNLAIARATTDVADQLGATPAQIALAWTMSHFRTVHPILGARRLEQLHDTLGAADRTLPPDVVATLDEVTAFDPGFPHDFIRDMQTVVFGEAGNLVDP
jgi:aryl-alcohol dehydrogenase-like predicted oxidoreductase